MKICYKYLCCISLFLAVALLGACSKTIDGLVEDPSTNRSFIPSNLRVRTAIDSAIITWNIPVLGSGKKLSYTVDISTDSLFGKIDYTKTADTTRLVILEPALSLATKYFARVKANPYKGAGESQYLTSASSFTVNGQQYIKVIRDFEITSNSVLLHWFTNAQTTAIDKVVLRPTDGGTEISVPVSAAEAQSGLKTLTGLQAGVNYRAQLLAASKSKGIANFRTNATIAYTRTISQGADLGAIITDAADGDIIGLSPGTYNLASLFNLLGKTVTLRSTSNNPNDTKINLREFSLVGDGAGVTFAGLEINGNYTGSTLGVQFLQLKGNATTSAAAATFKNITLDNCIIHDFSRCLFLGNLGTAVNDQKMGSFTINNCIIYNIDKGNTGSYYTFSMEKLLINTFSIRKSTLYAMGQALINMSTNGLSTTVTPAISIDYSTINNIGGGSGKQLLIDANANKVALSFTNNIFANTPISGTLSGSYRATSAVTGNTRLFHNNNYFKFYSALPSTALPLTGLDQVGNLQIDLGWTAATTTFSLARLPAESPLFKASKNGTTVGDPRWAY